ncbi:GNAT family N-acetyltransferase [Kitasatospora sp. NPDC058218]|uniref:GNAT family N-acetyltransferase n=1 Tax=Kitasatospora sp. NPDC058218 TaxID=3346385 RepID=UPI0036D9802A
MTLRIDVPRPDDAAPVARMQLRAWLQTYPDEAAGIDEEWIREHRASTVTAEGVARWREFVEDAARQPDLLFCRVVRSGAEVVGVLCGRRDEVVTLGPMYLLAEAQGQGVGGRLMDDFLSWAQDAPLRLWVTEYNERAIRFYERYGFRATGERELWRGRLPNVRMTRAGG